MMHREVLERPDPYEIRNKPVSVMYEEFLVATWTKLK
eukprot:CAMPEP_0171379742 /NCGR_PEP_ID=MMETSP0879-20121228/27448_1 /TAXON_ID=67004 /ORGANISM="Thalassiosira weissflogii, Strain CCMP1336" /LENGTH=36 /DNA_ID= /DNA_START= /DNA_END= /DNA_ORIENTATION=